MTTSEVASALGIDRSRVLRLINDGRILAEKHGRDWWVTKSEVERFKMLQRIPGWQKGKPRKSQGD